MVSKVVKVVNPHGIHMRPAQIFVAAVQKYPCDIFFQYGNKRINAKSLMNLMAACIKCGSELTVVCSGDQEEEAMAEAVALIQSGLGE